MTRTPSQHHARAPSHLPRGSFVFAVTDFEPAVGGTTRQTGLQARALSERGYDVVVVTRRLRDEWPRRELIDGIRVHRLGRPGRTMFPEKAALGELAGWLLRRRRSVAVFQPLMWTDAAFSAAAAGLLARTVLVWGIRGDASRAIRPGSSLPRRVQGSLRGRLLHRCRHVALTPRMAAELEGSGIARGVTVVPVPVDCRRFRPPTDEERRAARARLGLGPSEVAILYVGHLQRRKGIDRLIEAVRRLAGSGPAIRLLLVGGAPGGPDDCEEELREQVLSAGLDGVVEFSGVVPDPLDHLWAADVLALPSFREGMPNAILEGMACGLPVVAPESAAGDELLDAATGLVPATNEPGDLERALSVLLQDGTRRKQMGIEARNRALQFDIERVADRYELLYRDLTNPR